jgi:hypothetical protein
MSQAPQKVSTALHNTKLRLSVPCPTAKGKYSTLSYDIWNNNPRIVVSTNDPALMSPASGYGKITAALDTTVFNVYLELLSKVIESKENTKYKIENFGNVKGGDPKVPQHLTDLYVGRDDDGVFVSVISKQQGMPVIKFPFNISDPRYHIVKNATGEPVSKSEMSTIAARAYLRLLTQVMGHLTVSNWVKPEPYIPGNKPGGYSKPAYSQPSQGGSSMVDDENIPF